MNVDPVDGIMHVMQQAFNPAFGEAWTRRQVADALILPNTHYLLNARPDRFNSTNPEDASGFALSRTAADEEELLLIAVVPSHRGQGIGANLLTELFSSARERGSRTLFLEMRDGNPAINLYTNLGFKQIGRRRGYYRGATGGPLDAVTFAKPL